MFSCRGPPASGEESVTTMHAPLQTTPLRAYGASIAVATLLCLTLGLAPFLPEPHIVKQIVNIRDGRPMTFVDLLDLVIHGVPWLALIAVLARWLRARAVHSR